MFDSTDLLYIKIAKEICTEILADNDVAGKKVLSVRELSKIKKVNANTVQKAYQYLDDLGIFVAEHGLGRFVTNDYDKIKSVRHQLLISELRKVKKIAKLYNVSDQELCELYKNTKIVEGEVSSDD